MNKPIQIINNIAKKTALSLTRCASTPVWASGFGLRASGFGLRASGFGLRA
ncbi:MAG: hypothetical protein LBQ31_02475 [Bacteroidales bacterium]|nr:hypothetical protein [Bacteroidales bacterium]